jgi:hypothetical protein
MTLTRWKLMAGVLGLSIGGLAAMAESPEKGQRKSATPPTLPVLEMPSCPAVPAISSTPAIPCPPVSPPTFQVPPPPVPVIRTVAAVEPAPSPRPLPNVVLQAQTVEFAIPSPPPEPMPVVPVASPIPAPVPQPLPVPPPATAPVPVPAPQPTPAPAPPVTTLEPTPVVQSVPASASEKKLRVMLNMGDDRPRFEVRDGEEALLKVVCEKVDVKSPSDRGESMSTLKAVGRVTFVTPGGEGTCDELSVVPGTGQVVVSGKVAFRYTWGKVETEVSGERMTFRLGSTPGVVQTGGTTAVPASYRR